MKQKLATSWMLIQFPKEILQKEEYYHSSIFVNDVYRTPWKRPIPICKVNEEEPVTEVWKRYASFTDLLEKPMLHKNISFDIVPSSNPCSQIELQEVCSVPELYVSEDKHTHEECWKTILSTTYVEDHLLPEETVFVDHLAQFGQHLPRLSSLLSRLKTFPIKDPLVDWQRNLPAEKRLFRMKTSIEEDLKPNLLLEEFHVLPASTDEQCLSLPCTLELKESTQSRLPVSELITILQIAPEEMSEEDGKTNITGLSTKISPEDDYFIERNTIQRNLDPCKKEDMEDTVSFRSYHDYEIEVPITPPCSKPEDTMNKNCINLTAEELSPISTTFNITDADNDILECFGSHTDVKPLLLKVPLIKDRSEHLTIEELKGKISIKPDTSLDLTLEEDWSKLGSSMKDPNIIEHLNTNIPSGENLNPTEIESFKTIIADKPEGMSEKVSAINQKTSVHKLEKQSSCNDSLSVINHSTAQNNVIFMDTINIADMNADDIKIVTHGDETDQPKVFPTLLKDENLKRNLTPSKDILSVSYVGPASTSQQKSCKPDLSLDRGLSGHDTQAKDDADLLSSFIALRTKSLLGHSESKHKQKVPSPANDAQKSKPTTNKESVVCSGISEAMPEEGPKRQAITVHVTPSASQCHAYQVLRAAAEPVLNKLVYLEVFACMEWNFASVPFDCTRFFLRKQEKIISDKTGNKSEKDIIIFKNAALLHILVTLRDLALMCSLDATLEYLCKAKQEYKSVLGSYLDDIWRKLRIVQFVRDKTEELNPKITAFLEWIEKANVEYERFKVLMLTQMDTKIIEETLNNIYIGTEGLRAVGLCSASGNTFLKTKDVLDSLRSYSCVISNNQYIGSDFPWANFSLVIEYDCTDYWLQLCHKLNISHMTLKTSVPENLILQTPKHYNHLLDMHVPYVLLSSEELINNSELLHILESRYNMTFIERSSNTSLHLFGNKSHCAIITVDVSTVIILEELEELMQDKSAENLILKLVALSLQYSCCWVLLYNKSNQSEYSLSGEILHGVCLIYAAIIPFTLKSEDVDIKVLISSGIDETGSLIHQIVNYTLTLCKSDPYKWLDRSWLSVFISEAEKVLLSFPCINPMVAQLLLCRGSSLQSLLSATHDQLEELFPEVPSKVLKHFSDITALHQLSLSASPSKPSQTPTGMEYTAAVQGPTSNIPSPCVSNEILPQSDVLLSKAKSNKCNDKSLSFLFQKSQRIDKISQPLLPSACHTSERYKISTISEPQSGHSCCTNRDFGTFSKPLKKWTWSENGLDQHLHQSACLQDNTVDKTFFSGQHGLLQRASYHLNPVYKSNEQEPSFSINHESFYADLLSEQNSTTPSYCTNELMDAVCISQPLPSQIQRAPLKQTQGNFHNNLLTANSNEETDDSYYSQKGIVGKRRLTVNSVMTKDGMSAENNITQLPQLKRRKLTYERVPGRCDGQTRLKFF
ncbi:protein shortage in chiasmata 1 ortholog isoform X3 [Rhinoderma darwinii]